VKPGDLAGLQDAMRRLLEDPALRATMGRRALEKAAALSWDRGADGALAAIRECVDLVNAR
jgi:glycosyltransferase involved in cell wall biosynthesis